MRRWQIHPHLVWKTLVSPGFLIRCHWRFLAHLTDEAYLKNLVPLVNQPAPGLFSGCFQDINVVFFLLCKQYFKSSISTRKTRVYRRSIFKIRQNILIGLQKLRLRPKDRSLSQLFIYLNFLRGISWCYPKSTNVSLVVEF